MYNYGKNLALCSSTRDILLIALNLKNSHWSFTCFNKITNVLTYIDPLQVNVIKTT